MDAHIDVHRAGHAAPEPANEEAPTAGTVRGLREQEQGTNANCGTAAKTWKTLQSHAALAGYELTRRADGAGHVTYHVGRWGLSHNLPDLAAAARWLEHATGRRVA